jgi:hypothetical protein
MYNCPRVLNGKPPGNIISPPPPSQKSPSPSSYSCQVATCTSTPISSTFFILIYLFCFSYFPFTSTYRMFLLRHHLSGCRYLPIYVTESERVFCCLQTETTLLFQPSSKVCTNHCVWRHDIVFYSRSENWFYHWLCHLQNLNTDVSRRDATACTFFIRVSILRRSPLTESTHSLPHSIEWTKSTAAQRPITAPAVITTALKYTSCIIYIYPLRLRCLWMCRYRWGMTTRNLRAE